MPTNFPTSLDAYSNPNPTDDVSVVVHSTQHANHNDAVEAIEAKLGINSSAVTTSIDTSAGGFSGGGVGESFKLTKKHIDAIAERVWKYLLTEEKTAQDVLLEAAVPALPTDLSGLELSIKSIVIPETDLTPILEGISRIVIPKLDLEPVLRKIDAIKIPMPMNHSAEIQSLAKQINEAVSKLDKPDVLSPEVSKLLSEVATLQDNFDNKITAVLDKDPGVTALRDEVIASQEDLKDKLKVILEQVIETKVNTEALAEEGVKNKFEIIEELTK